MASLRFYALKGRNLWAYRLKGKCDPYVQVALYECSTGKLLCSKKTSSVFRTLNPFWNETLSLELNDSKGPWDLIIEVWDKTTVCKKAGFIGYSEWRRISIGNQEFGRLKVVNLQIKPLHKSSQKSKTQEKEKEKSRGSLVFSVAYLPDNSHLLDSEDYHHNSSKSCVGWGGGWQR
eukprot:TRINITY_DN15751_c0_g1_i1.p1 TRINITY_DN15751_c0_g1~~TRINITY_DN15751_c0_g1_i1.p1  ORF type:complete len:176 (-),score=24.70 TRINITY_DN15751_c0_g1_i1:535-1062(-)